MTTLWDDTPSALKSGGALDSLQPVLNSVQTPTQQERVEPDGHTWRVWTTTAGGQTPLSLDPATGGFSTSPSTARSSSTPLVFPDPRIDVELGLRLENGDPDEWYAVRDTDPILDPVNLPDSATLRSPNPVTVTITLFAPTVRTPR